MKRPILGLHLIRLDATFLAIPRIGAHFSPTSWRFPRVYDTNTRRLCGARKGNFDYAI